ncbi:MAG: helix-turn-helix domain-containing protein [Brachybacterium sp.]|nr:helix-turn-helix domain-containing protein [Brachybacterium sp.]
MAERRTYGSYNDGCAAAHALDLIGDRWTMIVVRELLLGPKRFVDLQRDILGIGPTVLTRRLQELVASGVARRQRGHRPVRTAFYELTPWGHGLEGVNAALASWAVVSPALPWDADMSPDTLMLTMRAHARARTDAGPPVSVGLLLTDSRHTPVPDPVPYLASMTATATTLSRASDLSGTSATLAVGTRHLKAAVLTGAGLSPASDAVLEGDIDAVELLLELTRLHPAPSGVTVTTE